MRFSWWWVPNLPPGLHQVERVAGTPRHDKSARSLLYLPSWSLVFMPYTSLTPRRWNSSKFLRWRGGALCLTNFLPLPDSLTTSSSSSFVCKGRLLRTRRGALFLTTLFLLLSYLSWLS